MKSCLVHDLCTHDTFVAILAQVGLRNSNFVEDSRGCWCKGPGLESLVRPVGASPCPSVLGQGSGWDLSQAQSSL